MRKLTLLVGFAFVLASCGGSAEPVAATAVTGAPAAPAQSDNEPTAAAAPSTDTGGADSSEPTTSTAAAAPAFDGPPAPDFELVLEDGSTFRLSDEQKPVYLVFWAEW